MQTERFHIGNKQKDIHVDIKYVFTYVRTYV